MWLGFIAALLCFTAVGAVAATRASDSVDDYLLAGRDVHPWLAGLSAVATNNSGFMFVGLLGYAYSSGLEAVSFQIAWLLGDLSSWLLAQRRVRARSGRLKLASLPRLLATRDDGEVDRAILVAGGLLTFTFLSVYAAAQLNAGSLALHSLLGWPMWVGAVIGAAIVLLYSVAGGIRASIWTDVAQSLVMLVAMIVLVAFAWAEAGSPRVLLDTLRGIDPALTQLWPSTPRFGWVAYLFAFVLGGFGAIGQPHIVVRTMSLRSPEDIAPMRRVYFAWFVPFSLLAVLAGLYARVILPDLANSGVASVGELALPELSRALLPEFAVGLVLAGLFAATMSTADSQVLACSAAVTQDVWPRHRQSRRASKLATFAVCGLALLVALNATESVFRLVLIAWSVLAATLAPVLVLRLFGGHLTNRLGVLMMGAALLTSSAWYLAGWSGDLYEVLPGVLAAALVWGVARVAAARAS
ncbi:MAG: sodium/proline symporter [Myxococcales bacterium]|nr:sodium/proline symporter [Myxococcales bacterium]MCB9629435.1 sodium/proline symporter [Sandaracinaceae bacterium]